MKLLVDVTNCHKPSPAVMIHYCVGIRFQWRLRWYYALPTSAATWWVHLWYFDISLKTRWL